MLGDSGIYCRIFFFVFENIRDKSKDKIGLYLKYIFMIY